MTAAERRLRAVTYASALLATPVLHHLAFPPARVHVLAWIAFVPLFAAIRLASPGMAILLTCATTLLTTYGVARWLPTTVAVYYGQPVVLGVALFVGAWTVTLAPWLLAFTVCYRTAGRRFTRSLPLLAGAAWVAGELGRARLSGNPFGLLGYSQAGATAVVQIADVTGVYGLSFIVAVFNAALAELWLAFLGVRRTVAGCWAGLGLAGAIVAIVVAYGLYTLHADILHETPETRVAIVQPNLDLGAQWHEDFYGRNLDEYMRLTWKAAATDRPALVVWPESAMTFFVEDEASYRAAIAGVLSPGGVQLLAGGPHVVRDRDPRFYNSAFLISPGGDILARYDKQRLLPFAEYFPVASIGLLRREFARIREFSPGPPAAPLATVAGAAGVVICNEVMFPEIAAERVRAGATYLVNLSNDSWPGDPQFAAEALDMARLRAIEERRYLVRASTSGPSSIVDPLGRIAVGTAPFTRATITGTLRASQRITLYGRFGDVFAVGCALVALAGALGGTLMPGTRRPEAPAASHPTAAAR